MTIQRSAFARVLRALQKERDLWDVTTGGLSAEHVRAVVASTALGIRLIPQSRVIVLQREQAESIMGLRAEDLVWNGESIPFSSTFLDFNDADVGDGFKLAGALLTATSGAYCYLHGNGLRGFRTLIWLPGHGGHRTLDLTVRSTGDLANVSDRVREVIVGTLLVLESANVDIVQTAGPPKGHQAHGVPHYEVVVRQNSKRYQSDRPSQAQDWSHRWEVRGHFKHFRKGATYDANPDRRVLMPDGTDCVRIWCPPYVKGPQDKPLIPKRRVIA